MDEADHSSREVATIATFDSGSSAIQDSLNGAFYGTVASTQADALRQSLVLSLVGVDGFADCVRQTIRPFGLHPSHS